MNIVIRKEQPDHIEAITEVTAAAFERNEHSSHTEQYIIMALRRASQLTLSLVALEGDVVVGHIAVSPVAISSGDAEWYGLRPLAVRPERQGKGIGSQLVRDALAALDQQGASGCVVLGEPDYYGRFGFKAYHELTLPGAPQKYFQALPFTGSIPSGEVCYHRAFDATA